MVDVEVAQELMVVWFSFHFNDKILNSKLEDIYPRLFKIFVENPMYEDIFHVALDRLSDYKGTKEKIDVDFIEDTILAEFKKRELL